MSNPALESFRQQEQEESSVKLYDRNQIEVLRQESRERANELKRQEKTQRQELERTRREEAFSENLVKQAEKESEEKNRLREIQDRKKLEKKYQRQTKKEKKQEKKLAKLEAKAEYVREKRRERKINLAFREERARQDHGKSLGKALGFQDEIRTVGKKQKLTPRERLEKQIRNKEKQLERLKQKLLSM